MLNRFDKQNIHVLVIPGTFPTTFNPTVGGFTFDQVIALSQRSDVQVGIVYPALRPWTKIGSANDFPESIQRFAVPIETEVCWTIPRLWPAKNWLFKRIGTKLLNRYISHHGRPDIIHAHFSILAGLFGLNASTSLGVPLVITEHMSTIMTESLTEWQKWAVSKVAQGADQVISVSNGLRNRILGLTGVDSEVIPNVVDLNRFCPSKKGSSNRSFLCVGSLTQRKRMDWLIRAFHHAFPDNQSVDLKIVGEGPERPSLVSLIKSLGEGYRIHLLGSKSREEVAQLMSEADFFALASSHETFGVVLIEALACDIPVVAADIEGPRDIVRPLDGILFETDNFSSLVSALIGVREHFVPRTGVYRSGVENRFGYGKVAEKLMNVYKSVLSRQSKVEVGSLLGSSK